METIIRRVSPGSAFRVAFFIYGVLGLAGAFLYGAMILFFALLGIPFVDAEDAGLLPIFGGLGAVAVVFVGLFFTAFYAALMAAFTALGAVVYNVVAGWTGGLAVQLESRPAPVWVAPAGTPQGPSAPEAGAPAPPRETAAPSPSDGDRAGSV